MKKSIKYTSISKEVTIMEKKKNNDVLFKGREVGENIETVGNNPC